MSKVHAHRYSIRKDSNGREYIYCRDDSCGLVVHQWDRNFKFIYDAMSVLERRIGR